MLPSFDQFAACWLQNVWALPWVQLVGCFYIFYQFALSDKRYAWKVLLAHALSGFCGSIIETCYAANTTCNTGINVAWLLGINEINWIIHEASTVLYSFLKFIPAIRTNQGKNILKGLMAVLFVIFAALRINIGVLRSSKNKLGDAEIDLAHAWAFIVWGFSDIVVLVLMIYHWSVETTNPDSISSRTISSLVQSSLPRISIIIGNTILIVIAGIIGSYGSPAIISSTGFQNFNLMLWMIKGTYPIILLMDLISTKTMLKAASASARNSQMSTNKAPSGKGSTHC